MKTILNIKLDKSIPDHPALNKKSQKLLNQLMADSKANKNIVGPFDSAEKMIRSLRSKNVVIVSHS